MRSLLKIAPKVILAVAAFALVAGDLEGKPAKPVTPPQTGTIIVYRKPAPGAYLSWNPISGFVGSALAGLMEAAQPLPLGINGKLALKLRYDSYCKVELPAGDYVFSYGTGWYLGGPPKQTVHVVAGKTIYFRFYSGAYHYEFGVSEDQNEARQDVSKLKPQS